MKLLFTIDRYPPDKGGGGATEVVRQIARRCVKLGHDVTIGCASNEAPKEYIWEGVRVRRFRMWSPLGQSIFGVWGETKAFECLLTDSSFDVVLNYAAQTWHTALSFPKLKRIRGAKILCACGFSGLIGFRRHLYASYFRGLPEVLKGYDAVVYHSGSYIDKQFADKAGLGNGVVIPNAVDGLEYGVSKIDIRSAYGITTKHIVVCIGDHYKNKGHKRVLDAFQCCSALNATLIIFGRDLAGPLRSCQRQCVKTASKSEKRIILRNNASREEIQSALASASVFLSGSYIEAFPLVILEAMASGVPFIAFDAGNIRELTGGVMVNSVREMAGEIDRLLSDDRMRVQLGALGQREQRMLYDWNKVVPRYLELFNRILQGEN